MVIFTEIQERVSYAQLGIANSGLAATGLGIFLIRLYIYKREMNFKSFIIVFSVPIFFLLNSYLHNYEALSLRRIANFWAIVCPALWMAAFVFYLIRYLVDKSKGNNQPH